MSTYRPSRPRRRLLSFLLLMTLLVSLVMPALAQEGVSPPKPFDGDAPMKSLASAVCTPLTDQERVEYDSLAARKADGLTDAEYGRLIVLGQKSDCAAQPASPTGPDAAANYGFASSIGTYTEITGGAVSTAAGDDARAHQSKV